MVVVPPAVPVPMLRLRRISHPQNKRQRKHTQQDLFHCRSSPVGGRPWPQPRTQPVPKSVSPSESLLAITEFSPQIDQHIIPFGPERQNIHLPALRWQRLARPRIKRPAMPRTDNRLALDPSLPQRPSPVRTHIVQRCQPSIHIRQADLNPIHLQLPHLARLRSLVHRAQPHPLTHTALLIVSPSVRC